jgi:hypothetical protein
MKEPEPAPLEAALKESYRGLQTGGSDGCPSAEALAALAIGEPADERERLADHIVSCVPCADAYQILARTHAESQSTWQRGLPRAAWLSAAAVLIAAAGAILFWRSQRPSEALRGGANEPSRLVSPAGGATVAATPIQLRWPALAGAESYRARLFDASGQTVWESGRLATASAELPSAARERLTRGQTYFWTVEAEMSLEKTRLGPYSFTIRGP